MKDYKTRYADIISKVLDWKDEYKELKTLRIEIEKDMKSRLKELKEDYDSKKTKVKNEFEILDVIKGSELVHKIKYDKEREIDKIEARRLLLPARQKELKELNIELTDDVILSYDERRWIKYIESNKEINETLTKIFENQKIDDKDKICVKEKDLREVIYNEIEVFFKTEKETNEVIDKIIKKIK